MKATVNVPTPVEPTITLDVSVEELGALVYWGGERSGQYPLWSKLLSAWRTAKGGGTNSYPLSPDNEDQDND